MGKAAPFFSVLFFIMMLALGFGSEFSIMESAMSTVVDLFETKINTKKKVILTRLVITGVFFAFGLTMVTRVRKFHQYHLYLVVNRAYSFIFLIGRSVCSKSHR